MQLIKSHNNSILLPRARAYIFTVAIKKLQLTTTKLQSCALACDKPSSKLLNLFLYTNMFIIRSN